MIKIIPYFAALITILFGLGLALAMFKPDKKDE
jgi:hypothetical protein